MSLHCLLTTRNTMPLIPLHIFQQSSTTFFFHFSGMNLKLVDHSRLQYLDIPLGCLNQAEFKSYKVKYHVLSRNLIFCISKLFPCFSFQIFIILIWQITTCNCGIYLYKPMRVNQPKCEKKVNCKTERKYHSSTAGLE